MRSTLFTTDRYKIAERAIQILLSSQVSFLTTRTSTSPRAVGDAVEAILYDHLPSILPDVIAEYSPASARRSMADIVFTDNSGQKILIDVKTHRLDTNFDMPNLTSVERLARLYEDDRNEFVMLMVKYRLNVQSIEADRVYLSPIEFIDWECLTIGALGWGQIQIKNSSNIIIREGFPRKEWMLQLCDQLAHFYPREVAKIAKRVTYFERVRERWVADGKRAGQ